MNELVVHHMYINGMAFDTSNKRNHGIPYSVSQAAPPFSPSFDFAVPNSRVIVLPSASLQDLIAVRAIVAFYLDPPGGLSRRYNIIEGQLSFALFVQPDGSLMGTILDGTGNWLTEFPESCQPGTDVARDGGPAATPQGSGSLSGPAGLPPTAILLITLRFISKYAFDPTPPVSTYPLPSPESSRRPVGGLLLDDGVCES